MLKPYYEATRIALNEDTKQEYEFETMLLWCTVTRIEAGVDDDSFKNRAPKTVIFTDDGSVWILAEYKEVRKAWAKWLDSASNIQSAFTNN
jgi:hypothetical protein